MNQPQRKVTLTSLTPKPTTYKAKAFCNNCDNVVEGDFEFAVPLYNSACPTCGCKHLVTMASYRDRQRVGASLTSVSRNATFNSSGRQLVDVDFSGVETRIAAYLRENPDALQQALDSHRSEFLSQYQQEPVRRSLLSEAGLSALRNAASPQVSEASRQREADQQRQETQRLQREATRYDVNYGTQGLAWNPIRRASRQANPTPSPTSTPAEIQAASDNLSPYRFDRQTGRTGSMPPYDVAMAADAAVTAVTTNNNGRRIVTLPLQQIDAEIDMDVVNRDAYNAIVAELSDDGSNQISAVDHTREQFERRVAAAASRRDAVTDARFAEMVQAIEESTGIGRRILTADSDNGGTDASDDDSAVVIGDSSSIGETRDAEESEQEGG